ncbi:cation-translocating P-type ATPase [Raoultibacter phocaeensis]|uniref:cation-translocating P-type ATPase n=1 Tax=Raoultibacter phocaeensis TaxID=2479841 RepID=UPI00111B68FE|nr:cation-translocating P-type ATPase [Raoultibacter phocaeensis]
MKPWYSTPAKTALEELNANPDTGLTESEVRARYEQYGPNEYAKPEQDGIVKMVLTQFKDLANVILLLAGFLSLALAIREGHGYLEPIVIFAIIVMNIALAVSQERGAEKALEALQSLSNPTCYVLRDGSRVEIETASAVPGDILILRTGDFVAADARIVSSTGLFVDESSLTGESEPAEKSSAPIDEDEAPLGDQTSMVFAGCLVTAGNAIAVITATGMDTEMGRIAGFLNNSQKIQTPLQKRLNRVSRMITIVAIVSAIVLVVVGLRQGEEFWMLMLAAVSLAVAAVPETLQLIVTLSLTHSVRKMVDQHALVRKLPAVETLGNTSIICSDKTGTLTQNRMTVQRLWIPGADPFAAEDPLSDEQARFLERLALASNATIEPVEPGSEDAEEGKPYRIVGDATESAIIRLLIEKGIDLSELRRAWPRIGEVPFSSDRKMMSSIHECPSGGYLVITKGAFDRLPFADDGAEAAAKRTAMHDAFADDALRLIALGSAHVEKLPEDGSFEELERNLTFGGLIGLIDPPRPEAAEAIAVAKRAGIRTIMITGDHAATAGAIAHELGLIGANDKVVTGRELSAMSDETLTENIGDYSVYARVSPEDKIRIVEAWQEHDEVVAMTGDGVNDAPALKAADVGVAMGQAGTEVAKSASDIVLTDDNFATIVAAVKEGRNVFDNIRKTLYFLLVCNMSEIAIILGAQLAGWGIALTPVMLLLINVLGDGIPGLSLAREEGDDRLMCRKPIARDESFFSGGLTKVIVQQALAFAVVGLVAYYLGSFVHLPGGTAPSQEVGQTMAFLVIAFTSILHIFTVRTRRSVFRRTIRDNMTMLYSALAMIALFTLMALIPPFGAIFGILPIGPVDWLVVIVLSVVPTIVAELFKLWDNRCESAAYRRRVVKHDIDDERFCL